MALNRAWSLAQQLPDFKKARPIHPNGALVCCTAHDDNSPSLKITWQGKRFIYNCYCGCDFRSIAQSIRNLGIEPITGEPLSDKSRKQSKDWKKTPHIETEDEKKKRLFLENHEYDPHLNPNWPLTPYAQRTLKENEKQTRYLYRDRNGIPTMLIYRVTTPENEKNPLGYKKERKIILALTPWRNKHTNKLFISAQQPPKKIDPFRAETHHRDHTIWLLEGEKCASLFEEFTGFAVPSMSLVSAHAKLTDPEILKDRPIIVIKDTGNGENYVSKELASLIPLDNVVSIPPPWRINEIPPPRSWDMADEIVGKPPYKNIKIKPITMEEFIKHLTHCLTTMDISKTHSAILQAGIETMKGLVPPDTQKT